MGLRLRQRQRTYKGVSSVAGWGLFCAHPLSEGQYLGEYCGELIPDSEAERRGQLYDSEENSYLMRLTEELVGGAVLLVVCVLLG